MVILRQQRGKAAVTPDFPCCLLDDDELLDIKFIKSDGNRPMGRNLSDHSPENLVSFYVKTRGEENIRTLMKNNELKKIVNYVCVCAVKEETVKKALRHDGRFKGHIFKKGILAEESSNTFTSLSSFVDDLDGKWFEVTVSPHPIGSQESSQELSQELSQESETVKNEKNEVPVTPQATNTNQDSTNAQKNRTETPLKEKEPRKYPETKEIPNTQEILKLLREQYGGLLKTLKEREKLKKDVEVKRFFRQEYDKSAQSFSEVKRVKELMVKSDSVCQIRSDGFAIGTGFLLFHRFVLTNAHVVGEYDCFTQKPQHRLTAAFGFEDLNSVGDVIPAEKVVAYFWGKDGMRNCLDFALLELSRDEVKLPGLLECYSASPSRGGVCIIGHPGGGVKQMDPCFMIAKYGIQQAAEEHYQKNKSPEAFHIITQQCLNEDLEKRKSQILYNSCFFHGSSGSPVFDDKCNVIGVHTGGYVHKGEGQKTKSVMEYALPMLPILVKIYIQCRQTGRSDVVQYMESQNNMKYVLQEANEQLQKNKQAI